VDPVSHLLLARIVAAGRSSREVPKGVIAATVLGGIAPDIDGALMAVGWDVYLRWHELGTHALAGLPLVALLTAAVVRTWAPATSIGALAFGALLGALSHVCFDLYSGAGIRLLWPLSAQVFAAPVVAMADPIAIAALIPGAVALWIWPRAPRTAAVTVLVLLAVVAGVKLTTRNRAWTAYTRATREAPRPSQVTTEAVWGSWTSWLFFDRLRDGRVRAWTANGLSGDVRLRFEHAGSHDETFARRSLDAFATARNFLPAHPYAFATYRDTGDGSVAFWSDARFCWNADERADPQDGVPHQDVRPAIGPIRCALWFGGSLDAAGRPREALVWLGGHLQRRDPNLW
jgi:membrane-bound metal-dependent hydrolase YbcI (DUF457 family)